MMQKARWGAAVVFFLSVASVSAEVLGTSARQMPAGSLKLLTYYEGTEDQELNFSVNGSGNCGAVGAASFSCTPASANVSAQGSGGRAMAKLVYQPWESFQYYVAGGAGDYAVRVPSAAVTNLLTGDYPGAIFVVGMKAVLFPDTIVTPAVAVDASLSRARYHFNRVFPGGTPGVLGNIDQRMDLLEYQVAMETSHLFNLEQVARLLKLEPYAGVKWNKVAADIKDLVAGGHAGGQQDSVRPFFGLRIPVFEHEQLWAEASFVDGTQYAGGLEVRFK